MKIGIITAMKEEADNIVKYYKLFPKVTLQNIHIFEGNNIILVLAGIGKIQATIGTSYLFLEYKIDMLINIGIAGSLLGASAKIGDVFIVDTIYQHDLYLPFEGSHLDYGKKEISIGISTILLDNKKFDFGIKVGAKCLTGDQFIDDQDTVNNLYKKYGADIVEMEAFGIASVARELNLLNKCIFIKAISDGANNESRDEHMGNLDFAMKNSILVLVEIISQL